MAGQEETVFKWDHFGAHFGRLKMTTFENCSTKVSKNEVSKGVKKGEEVTRAEGPQSARLFTIGIILEPILVGQK